LEVLKFLAGLASTLDDNEANKKASLIVDPTAIDPTISDVLEILKKLADLPNLIDGNV